MSCPRAIQAILSRKVARKWIRQILDSLPDDASWEDVQYSIYVRERIEHGRREVDEDRVIDQAEVESRMRAWLGK